MDQLIAPDGCQSDTGISPLTHPGLSRRVERCPALPVRLVELLHRTHHRRARGIPQQSCQAPAARSPDSRVQNGTYDGHAGRRVKPSAIVSRAMSCHLWYISFAWRVATNDDSSFRRNRMMTTLLPHRVAGYICLMADMVAAGSAVTTVYQDAEKPSFRQAAQKGPAARRGAIRGARRTSRVRRSAPPGTHSDGWPERRRWAFFSSLLKHRLRCRAGEHS